MQTIQRALDRTYVSLQERFKDVFARMRAEMERKMDSITLAIHHSCRRKTTNHCGCTSQLEARNGNLV
jgi:hypothetical protein